MPAVGRTLRQKGNMKEYLVDQVRRGFGTYLFCWSIALLVLGHKDYVAVNLFILSAILFACNLLGAPVVRPTKRAGDNGNESED